MSTPINPKDLHRWTEALPGLYKNYKPPTTAIGMTTPLELCLVETYAREAFTGAGKIVDLGCWMGATTLSLARGLRQNKRSLMRKRIEAFDLFIWEDWMDPIAHTIKMEKPFRAGECFFEPVRQFCEPYKDIVEVYKQDLMEYQPPAEPVEFLFVDAMKTWGLAERIVTQFFPRLMAGQSYIVQQDFAYFRPEMATNHLIMWHLRDHFDWVLHVPWSCSVLFWFKQPFAPGQLPAYTPEFFTPDMVEQAYEYSYACVSDDLRHYLHSAKLNFLIEQGHAKPARQQLDYMLTHQIKMEDFVARHVREIIAKRRAVEAAAAPRGPSGWLEDLEAALPESIPAPPKRKSFWSFFGFK